MDAHGIRENKISASENSENSEHVFHLILFSDSGNMHELWLPAIPEGYFRFDDSAECRFCGIASKDGQWVAVCKRPAFFRNVPLTQSYEMPLSDGLLLIIDVDDMRNTLYVESVARKHMVYHNYMIPADTEICIGKQSYNDIWYNNPHISEKHAVLYRTNGIWSIQSLDQNFGIYVNGARKDNIGLKTGDVVCLLGLRIIIGPNILSINEVSGTIRINQKTLQDVSVGQNRYSHYYGEDGINTAERYFNRLPRKRFEIAQKTIAIEGPPMSMDQKQMPLMLRMGSSMVMGGAAALAGNFMTLISSVMFPFLSTKYTEKQRYEYEQLRLSKYREYLRNKTLEIEKARREEEILLNQKYPVIYKVADVVKEKVKLWERRPGDNDFLHIRLGTGSLPLTAIIDYPAKHFQLQTDQLEDEMYQLAECPQYVDNVPVVHKIAQTRVSSLVGQRNQVLKYINQMVLQIAAFHSYDEVKTVFILTKEELSHLDEIRYLPHTWDNERTIRFVATDDAEVHKVGEYIKEQIADDKEGEKDLQKLLRKRPYYVIFALNKKLFESHEGLKDILQSDEISGVSIITAYDELPKESQTIITLESDKHSTCTTMSADGGDDVRFWVDDYSRSEFLKAMRILANTRLKTAEQAVEIPKMVTFLEMFKVGRIEQLNPLKRWQESNPVKSLAAPVGVGADGSPFMLDLHEKRQGPHGLVAGMTGSGKSEFIITYILSMAVNYHPDEVAFVLIDYKGGGLADAFDNPRTGVRLPHLAGTITNLDGASIQRSLMSIESELVRRQKVFSDVGKSFDEGSMNIYTYQKLYRAGKVSEPMPHLFIISDEFAELKQQQPEFMDKLISAARIGRSLGVHLILATQKPSGVVNDQIRSNTKFRVCLRVQDRSDSMDMLKRPEAAELTDTGRFYLQVGYNEYFAMGQSAWCGADYEPQDTVVVQKDDAVEFLDTVGQVVAKNKPKVKKTSSGMKQIGAVVQYLSELAKNHGIQSRQLWQPELPKELDLEKLQNMYQSDDPMTVYLGQIDDPEKMCQFPLQVDFSTCGNLMIVGDNSSGKSTIIQNVLYSLTKQLSPLDFNFYALDYSSRMLKLFKPLPHCGEILTEEDTALLSEFFNMINTIIADRKKVFSDLEVDNFEDARKVHKLPLILVVIDNLAGLLATKDGEKLGYNLCGYLKNSANYGVKYIIANTHINEIPARARQELTEVLCLHLKDKYDYSELLGCKVTYTPPELCGRGLVKYDGRPLEFQGAIFADTESDQRRTRIKSFVVDYCKYGEFVNVAQRLKVINENAEYEEFAAQFPRERIPIGYSLKNKKSIALPLKQLSALSIYLGNSHGLLPISSNIIHAAKREKMDIWIVAQENSIFGENGVSIPQNTKIYPQTKDSIALLKQALLNVITERLNTAKAFPEWKEELLKHRTIELADDVSLFYSFMQNNVKPILLLFENFQGFCACLDAQSELVLIKLFALTQKLSIYLVGMFGPDGSQVGTDKTLYQCFNPERNIMLLGGQYQKQNLCDLPKEAIEEKLIQYNKGIMHYRKANYDILMPCGEIPTTTVDPDTEDIFM